jgi:hypothetical protein
LGQREFMSKLRRATKSFAELVVVLCISINLFNSTRREKSRKLKETMPLEDSKIRLRCRESLLRQRTREKGAQFAPLRDLDLQTD